MHITDNRKLQTQKDYSRISQMYADDFGKDRDHFEMVDFVIQKLKEHNREKYTLVDLGAGSGVITDYLIEKGIEQVLAIDLTPDFCEMIRQKHGSSVRVMCEDMSEAVKHMQAEHVGAYIANFSLIHIPDEEVDLLLSGIFRTLIKGGLFVMSCHKGTYKGMEQEPYQAQKDARLHEEQELSTYMNYFTEEELRRRIESAGLELLKMETVEAVHVPGEIPVPKIWVLAQK